MSVPDNNTFGLDAVRTELGLAYPTGLGACFTASVDANFDQAYKGSKDRLSNFRNYNGLNKIEIIDIVSYPWFSGTGLGDTKKNVFAILYRTGVNFTPTTLNVTRWVKWQSDNSNLYDLGARNDDYVNTQRLAILDPVYNLETSMSPGNLYFYLTVPSYWFYTNNSSITITGGTTIRKDFSLVAGSTTACTLTLDINSMEYTYLGGAISANHFHVNTAPSTGAVWYARTIQTAGGTDYTWITASQWYGTNGECTVTCSNNSGAERTGYIYCRALTGKYDYPVTVLQRAYGYSTTWLSYVTPSFSSLSDGYLYLTCHNDSSAMNDQQKTFYWQTRDEFDQVVNSGDFASNVLDAGQTSNHNFYVGSSGWTSCYMSPNNTDWYYFSSNN